MIFELTTQGQLFYLRKLLLNEPKWNVLKHYTWWNWCLGEKSDGSNTANAEGRIQIISIVRIDPPAIDPFSMPSSEKSRRLLVLALYLLPTRFLAQLRRVEVMAAHFGLGSFSFPDVFLGMSNIPHVFSWWWSVGSNFLFNSPFVPNGC